MSRPIIIRVLTPCILLWAFSGSAQQVRIATFNVSIEATNYLPRETVIADATTADIVRQHLAGGEHPQLKNIAEIIQRVRPDVLLLNEFDYRANPQEGIQLFIDHYLNIAQNGQPTIDYIYYFVAPSNTGLATPFDLDKDGHKSGSGGDAMGFGLYPGHYGMALLSRFPIQADQIRTLQKFLWKDMPNALAPVTERGEPWYTPAAWEQLRLASKSFWDIPINTPAGMIHVLASHPTPPTFDGAEDRNGKRNHDEIRLLVDYISNADYLYADDGSRGGLAANEPFVVLGDLNASPVEGDALRAGINALLGHARVNNKCLPASLGGSETRPDNEFAPHHTAAWGLRVDYALPAADLNVTGCGVFWPTEADRLYRLVSDRAASSDHRLTWVDIQPK